MKGNGNYLNWRHILRNAQIHSIDEDLVLLDNPVLGEIPDVPFLVNVTTVILCRSGQLEGRISLQPFQAGSPSLVVLLADHILELKRVGHDFRGQVLVMSKSFTDNLLTDIQERIPLTRSIEGNPCLPLTEEAFAGLEPYFSMIRRLAAMTGNPERKEVARHLMLAFMYGTRAYFHPQTGRKLSHPELLTEKFLSLVKENYRRERLLKFYADKLSLSAKYISKIVKDTTGKPANRWIDEYVMLEAKALLRSSDKTIQQIAYGLSFDDASFFAKYFRHHLGISPSQYRLGREGLPSDAE